MAGFHQKMGVRGAVVLLAATAVARAGSTFAEPPPPLPPSDLPVAPDVLVLLPPPGAPTLVEDTALAEASATLEPYRVYRVQAYAPRPGSEFDPPLSIRALPPATVALVSSSVDAEAPGALDRATPRRVVGAVILAPPPTQVWRMRADLDVQAGDRPDPAIAWPGAPAPAAVEAPWSRVGGGVSAGVALSPAATLDLALSTALDMQTLSDRSNGPAADDSRQAQQASLTLGLAAAPGLRIGMDARASEVDDVMGAPDAATSAVALRTGETTAGLNAAWTLGPALQIELADRMGYGAAAWREAGGTGESYALAEPDVAATVKPWAGARWRLSFGHAVSPLDLGAFAAVAQGLQRAADIDAGVRLAPNQEWRAQAQVSQTLPGGAALGVTLTDAHLDTTQELARNLDGIDLPVSIDGGERRQLDLSLITPLSAVALDGFTLQTAAAVRGSQITDPVTGLVRRLSGEAPYDASVAIAQDVAPLALRWGVLGHVQAAQVYYTPEETSTAAAAQSLGMFVEYHPTPFALRLQVDGLAGGTRDITDALYDGSRDSDRIVHIDHRFDGGPAVSLMLRKAL